jgi:hypothetical protein
VTRAILAEHPNWDNSNDFSTPEKGTALAPHRELCAHAVGVTDRSL